MTQADIYSARQCIRPSVRTEGKILWKTNGVTRGSRGLGSCHAQRPLPASVINRVFLVLILLHVCCFFVLFLFSALGKELLLRGMNH